MSGDQKPYGGKKLRYREVADVLLGDQSISYWLKDAVQALDKRDPADALNDTALLFQLQKIRTDEALENATGTPDAGT